MKLPHVPVWDYDHELTATLKRTLSGAWSDVVHEPGKIYISALGGCLYHDVWLSAVQQQEEWNNGDMPAFLGEAFEELIVKCIAAGAWPDFKLIPPPEGEVQHRVTGENYGIPILSGKLDGLLKEGPMTRVMEIKLMSPWRFRDLMRGHIVKDKGVTLPGLQDEFPNYYTQVQTYMGLLNLTQCIFIVGASYRQPIIAYIDQEFVVARIPFDQPAFDTALERAEYIQECLSKGKEPVCEHRKYCKS